MPNSLNILLVEDNKAEALLQKIMLENHFSRPYSLEHVTCLGAAIGEIQQDEITYDLVLLDLNLGDSRGLNTLQVFKNFCNNIPVIILSGITEQKVIDEAILKGADSYIVKGRDKPSLVMDEICHTLDNYHHKLESHSA